jgi:hypothetical protein
MMHQFLRHLRRSLGLVQYACLLQAKTIFVRGDAAEYPDTQM